MTGTEMRFAYTNYRGEKSLRRVRPLRMWWGATPYHPRPQWLLSAIDLDKAEERIFAVADMAPHPEDTFLG